MNGQIPKYGEHFRLVQVAGYHPWYSARRYVLKADASYYIQADKTSKIWLLFCGSTPFARRGSLTAAMALMRTVTSEPVPVDMDQPQI